MSDKPEFNILLRRIAELEEKVEQLRFSRRVLMNLLERVEKEKTGCLNKLEEENKRLQFWNARFAKRLLSKNRQIVFLEEELQGKQRSPDIDLETV